MDAAALAYPDAPRPWIDLSTGINPQAYPVGAVPAPAWERLPEVAAVVALEAAAACRYQAPAHAEVIAAPGTQAIIQWLPSLVGTGDVRVLGRTYGEFSRVLAAVAPVRIVDDLRALAGAEMAVIVNPNNPDGRCVSAAALADVAASVGTLVVDEAYMDTLEAGRSLVPLLPGRTLVLRSFGKFYGLAGLRLGFGVTTPELASRLRDGLGPWAVSGPALVVGTRALVDTTWAEATRRRLAAAAHDLDTLLTGAGLVVVGGTPLFRLARHVEASRLFDALGHAGILVRPFADAPTWLRFGLPASPEAWTRLETALSTFAAGRI